MLTIVTANLQRAYLKISPYHWRWRKNAVEELLSGIQPHIVCTQELVFNSLTDIMDMLPNWGYVGKGRNGELKGEFVAILYNKNRLKLEDEGTFWLSKKPEVAGSRSWWSIFPCICTWGEFTDLETGKLIKVYNTHLDHISPIARNRGLRVIRNHMEKHTQGVDGVVLTGDFNTTHDSKAILQFHEGPDYNVILNQAIKEGRTFHAFSKNHNGNPIDYIFTSKNIEINKAYIERSSFKGRYPSDHYPIVAQITVK